jgi:hypothetical protein
VSSLQLSLNPSRFVVGAISAFTDTGNNPATPVSPHQLALELGVQANPVLPPTGSHSTPPWSRNGRYCILVRIPDVSLANLPPFDSLLTLLSLSLAAASSSTRLEISVLVCLCGRRDPVDGLSGLPTMPMESGELLFPFSLARHSLTTPFRFLPGSPPSQRPPVHALEI